jgi:hypothetical protein
VLSYPFLSLVYAILACRNPCDAVYCRCLWMWAAHRQYQQRRRLILTYLWCQNLSHRSVPVLLCEFVSLIPWAKIRPLRTAVGGISLYGMISYLPRRRCGCRGLQCVVTMHGRAEVSVLSQFLMSWRSGMSEPRLAG